MANQKNTQTTSESSGFKTVAFGFDKNEVTLYIASLRKKMKALEEEYEMKIEEMGKAETTNAANASRESELARQSIENSYIEKLDKAKKENEQLNKEIERLKVAIAEKQNENRTLQEQLDALAANGSESDAACAQYAKTLAEATAAAATLLGNAKALNAILGGTSDAEDEAPAAPKAQPAKKKAEKKPIEKPVEEPAIKIDFMPETDNFEDFGDEAAEEAEIEEEAEQAVAYDETFDELKSDDFADLLDVEPEAPAEKAEEPAAKPAAEPSSEFADVGDLLADEEEVRVEPISNKVEADIDFSDLLADDGEAQPEDIQIEELNRKTEKGEDLGDDLYEILINPEEELKKADLEQMLLTKEEEDVQANHDLEIQPADIDENMAAIIAAAENAAVPELTPEQIEEKKADVKPISPESGDVFDFAFDDNESSDDEDMGTDNFGCSEMM